MQILILVVIFNPIIHCELLKIAYQIFVPNLYTFRNFKDTGCKIPNIFYTAANKKSAHSCHIGEVRLKIAISTLSLFFKSGNLEI
jgi:hypothetical protein